MASRPNGPGTPRRRRRKRQRWRLSFGALTWRTEDRVYAGWLELLRRGKLGVLDQPCAPPGDGGQANATQCRWMAFRPGRVFDNLPGSSLPSPARTSD
jgi:hypothetical protein